MREGQHAKRGHTPLDLGNACWVREQRPHVVRDGRVSLSETSEVEVS